MSPPDFATGGRRAALAFIFVTVVLDMLALGMVIPVLPKLIEDFLGGDTAGAAHIYGIFGTVWALMQFLSMPVVGALSDRFGRRPVILTPLRPTSMRLPMVMRRADSRHRRRTYSRR